MRKNISPTLIGVRAHPLVERAAVNRVVVGSSPTRGAKQQYLLRCSFLNKTVGMKVLKKGVSHGTCVIKKAPWSSG